MKNVAVVDVLPQQVIGIRRRGRYEEIAPMIMELAEFATRRDIEITAPPAFLCHEESPEAAMQAAEAGNADLEVVFPVAGAVEGDGEIRVYELPGGTMARIIHMGPYRDCGEAYEELFAWLAANKKDIIAPLREVYVNDPCETPEDDLVTWIYAPIA
ncbi:transcriptional regulator [Methanoculleus sp. FWC-SCC1]|uniref:Transcriptional regulator n=1 Tax=Methanoculleus frigidifontis TaxID=2584085 RepID=A0ABT8MB80_9EURY|nr:GyrI-like domain-containing protein [Methanoculleus sp. FWC-SCC1]MDN7025193.1 transcriptional regulator [Methanoculleus sp. FWC-SCC1]